MSNRQIEATALLCRLLDRKDAQIDGRALFEGEWSAGAGSLVAAKLLIRSGSLTWVKCTECWIESARVVRELPGNQIRLLCPECEEVDAPDYVRDTYKPVAPRLISKLLVGLDFSVMGKKAIDPDTARAGLLWRLGTSVPKRGQPVTWYFARMLHRPENALRLREQIASDNAARSAVVLTTSEVPLPAGSPLTGFDVRPLFTVGQVEEHGFTFFSDRIDSRGPQVVDEAAPDTTLRYVKTRGVVFLNGEEIELEPRQRKLLEALIDDLDHELDKDALRDKVGSVAKTFSPSKVFDRIPNVYRAFISYCTEDERYALVIPDDDRDWLR